jgi:hypothetical protein
VLRNPSLNFFPWNQLKLIGCFFVGRSKDVLGVCKL